MVAAYQASRASHPDDTGDAIDSSRGLATGDDCCAQALRDAESAESAAAAAPLFQPLKRQTSCAQVTPKPSLCRPCHITPSRPAQPLARANAPRQVGTTPRRIIAAAAVAAGCLKGRGGVSA